jgi:hypothetical protein
LASHPLAIQLQNADSIESITTIVQDQASAAFSGFREKDRIIKSIKNILSILNALLATASFGDTVGLRPPVVSPKDTHGVFHISDCFTVIPSQEIITRWPCYLTCRMCLVVVPGLVFLIISYLYQAARGRSASYDELVDLLESIDHFLRRLDIYTQIPHTPALDEMLVRLIVELLSTLALATIQVKQERSSSSELILFDMLSYSMPHSDIR